MSACTPPSIYLLLILPSQGSVHVCGDCVDHRSQLGHHSPSSAPSIPMNAFGSAFSVIKPRNDDSGMDRLNYYYTPAIIAFISVTLTAKQYVGEPLQCWVPAQFSRAWEQYAENYCFVYNTYWVRPDEEVPTEVDERIAAQLVYYQWVPFIMALEAGLFHLPSRIWAVLAKSSGLSLESMVNAAVRANEDNDEEKLQACAVNICSLLEDSNQMRKLRKEGSSAGMLYNTSFGEADGTYLSNVYLIAKVIYCVNSIVQFLTMNKFLKQPDSLWGASILADIVSGKDWEDSGNFPRIAMCDFQVRTMGNLQRYSIQCVLIINMFNEKIFLFLYWWIITIGLLTVFDAIRHILTMKMPSRRRAFIKRFITCKLEERAVLEDFAVKYISPDMFLIIKMINGHTSEFVTGKILQHLFDNYKSSKETLQNHPYLLHLVRRESEVCSEDPLSCEVQSRLLASQQDNYDLAKFCPISFQSPVLE